MSDDIPIHAVGAAHAGVLAALHCASFSAGDQWQETAIRELLPLPGTHVGLAVEGEHPAGFIMIRCVAGEVEILTICVAAEYRQHGVGTALLTWAIQQAEAEEAETLFLEVSSHNHVAQRVYQKAGFRQVGLRKRYYPDGSDAFVLGYNCNRAALAEA